MLNKAIQENINIALNNLKDLVLIQSTIKFLHLLKAETGRRTYCLKEGYEAIIYFILISRTTCNM